MVKRVDTIGRISKHELRRVADASCNLGEYGDFRICVFKNITTNKEHVVLILGDVSGKTGVLCRIASECLPGMVFHYQGCECREQLDKSMKMIRDKGQGIFIFLRQEGRGQGLAVKVRAMVNKNKGYDTFTAVEMLGLKADVREYWEGAEIIRMLKPKSVRLLTNNPDKIRQLKDNGIKVIGRVDVEINPTKYTKIHLEAKQKRGYKLLLLG